MRFLDIDNNKRILESNSYLATIDTITDKKTVKYDKLYFVVTDNLSNSKRCQISENTYNKLVEHGLETDDNKKFPFYQISDIKQRLYEYNISCSVILKTELIEDETKYYYFLGNLQNNKEIEISADSARELQRRFNIDQEIDETKYKQRFN